MQKARAKFRFLLGFMLPLLSLSAASAATIDYPYNYVYVGYWGPPYEANRSFGQVFTSPGGILIDYSLIVGSYYTPFPFESQLYQWNGKSPSGPALFTSSVFYATTSPILTTYTFAPGVSTSAGTQYIAFVTNQPGGVSLGGSGYGYIGLANTVAGSPLVGTTGDPTSGAVWSCITPDCYLTAAFTADFGEVSVPGPTPGAGFASLAFLALVGAVERAASWLDNRRASRLAFGADHFAKLRRQFEASL
jgi:hypothetical protein